MAMFSEIWAAMILRQPKLLDRDAKIEITVEQFRKALSQAFDAGARSRDAKQEIPDFMRGLFG